MSQTPAQPENKDETALAKPVYTPGGISKEAFKPVENPNQSDTNFPFSAGRKMHEVQQSQNLFTFPLDTAYNVLDAIAYFSNPVNRERYTYDQQQLVISRIVRAAIDFGIDIEGVREKIMV